VRNLVNIVPLKNFRSAETKKTTGSTGHRIPTALSSYDRTKEISCNPYFRGGISRWVWRFYMYRITAPACWFIALTCVFILYGTTSIDLYIFIPLMYSFGIWFIAWLIAMFLPPKAHLDYQMPRRVAKNASVPVRITLTSSVKSPMVDLVVIPMRLPPSIEAIPLTGARIDLLEPHEEKTVSLSFVCHFRGVYRLKGFRLETAFPLGLLRAYSAYWNEVDILVFPTFQSLSFIDLPTGKRYQPGGVALASKLGESTEYIGDRDYRDGDNVRDIDWKATARLMRPIVREYREEYFYRVGVIQDTFVPKGDHAREDDFESAISICAAVSDYMAREEYIVDLFAAGPNLYHLSAGRNLAFQDQILDILACLEPAKSEPFKIIEPELLESLSQLTTVICVMLDWDEVRRAFVDRIREVSAVKVVIVRDAPCTLDPTSSAADLSLTIVSKQVFAGGVTRL